MFAGVSSTTRIFAGALMPLPVLEQALHGLEEFLQVDRLADEAVEAGGGDLAAIGRHHRGGERDDRDARASRIGAQLPQRLDAVDAGQLDVHQHEVGLLLDRQAHALLAGHGLERVVALGLQHVARELHVLLVVLDDQDRAHGLCGKGER